MGHIIDWLQKRGQGGITMPKRRAYRILIHGQRESSAGWVESSLMLSIGEVVGNIEGSTQNFVWPKAGILRNTVIGEVDLENPAEASLRLRYELDGLPIDQCVRLTRTEQPLRWWFVCPAENNRVANLYLPLGARQFASRKAHGLIYKCQVQPKRGMLLSPNEVRRIRRLKSRS